MTKLARRSISRRTVEALKVQKDTVFWDSEQPGFGVRVYPTGAKHYVVQTRARGSAKRLTVGRHGVITPEEARRRAALIIARIKAGEDPLPEPLAAKRGDEPTVAQLAERYLREYAEEHCKANTVTAYRRRTNKHIVPALGKRPLSRVRREDVRDLHYAMRSTPVMANRTLDLLSRMFNMAESWGLLPEGSNPCRGQTKYREQPRERFLTGAEFRRLGHALDRAESGGAISAHAAAAIRAADADRMPEERDPDAALEGRGPEKHGTASCRYQDGCADCVAVAGSRAGARGDSARRGQPLGDPGPEEERAAALYRPSVVPRARARETQGGADSRLPALFRLARAGARGELARDRQAARPCPCRDHGAVRASGPGFHARGGGAGRRQHRRRHSAGTGPR